MFTACFPKDGCIYSRNNDPGEEYCFSEVDVELGADVECEADNISKHELETEREELIEIFHFKVNEKELLVQSLASAEEAFSALEIARQKILSLGVAQRLEELSLVAQTCSQLENIFEKIEKKVQESEFKETLLFARNIR